MRVSIPCRRLAAHQAGGIGPVPCARGKLGQKTGLLCQKGHLPSTRLNKIFILFNRIYLFKAPPSCGYRWQLGGNMVADWRKQVKIEQNQLWESLVLQGIILYNYSMLSDILPLAVLENVGFNKGV